MPVEIDEHIPLEKLTAVAEVYHEQVNLLSGFLARPLEKAEARGAHFASGSAPSASGCGPRVVYGQATPALTLRA